MGDDDESPSMCGKCGQEITGKAMKAKDVLYHEDGCFVCVDCSADLREAAVYAKEGKLHCEACYMAKFVPKCAKCLEYITEVSMYRLVTVQAFCKKSYSVLFF